jgi:site-specific recombinase XerD
MRQQLADRYPPSTANLTLSALRGVLKACWRMRLMTAENFHTTSSVPSVTGERLPKGRALTGGELAALMRVCSEDRSAAGPRDAALFALLYACGLRKSEAVGLEITDYDRESGAIKIRRAKRNKQRIVYVADAGAQSALDDWLRVRSRQLEAESGPLFIAIDKKNRMATQALSSDSVNKILDARAKQVEMPHTTPHDFRRTFVGDLLDAGADIASVQRLAGHSNVATTIRYDRRPEAAKKKAASLLRVPYRSRVS